MVENISNKRIAKNTVLLYFRMFLIMGVGLYTSRVVLQALGVSDYGVYNVVGGAVSMLAYLNTVFVAATQRFLAFAIGKGNMTQLRKVFSTSVSVHYLMALLIFIVAETFGIWFVNNHLVINPDRLIAANWVFQCSLLTMIINIITIPYNASLVAHEHLNVYAYMSIFDILAKLLVVYVLWLTSFDKLIVYAELLVIVSAITCCIYICYCKRHFEECHYKFVLDKPLLKEMISYAGWTFVGGIGFVCKDQGINIVINLFFGTTVNAARGVAMQVSGMANQFANNFMMAVSPQITKQYAAGDIERSRSLVYMSSKFSLFLLALIVIPLSLNLEYVLRLWLGTVPQYTYEFLQIILVSSLFASMATALATALNATGDIKKFQIGVSSIFMLELPLSYILLKLEYPPYIALLPSIATQISALLYRFYILREKVEGYSLRYYIINVLMRPLLVLLVALLVCGYIHHFLNSSFLTLSLTLPCYIIITCVFIYIVGLSSYERAVVKVYANKIISKICR